MKNLHLLYLCALYAMNFLPWERADVFHLKNLKDIKELIGDCILDVGCGVGRFYKSSPFLEKTYLGIDISKTSIDFCKRKYQTEDKFLNVNVLNFKTNTEFSFILDIGCIHLISPVYHKFLLKKYIHLLSSKGVLYISFFNNLHDKPLFFLEDILVYGLSRSVCIETLSKEGKVLKVIEDTLYLENNTTERITIIFQKL